MYDVTGTTNCCRYLNPMNYCLSGNQGDRFFTKSNSGYSAELATPNSTHAKSFREFFPVNCRNLCSSAGLKHFLWLIPSTVGGAASGGGTYAILACATKASSLTALSTAGIVAGASIAGAGALGATAAFSSYAIYRCIVRCSSNSDDKLDSTSDEENKISSVLIAGYGTTGTTGIDILQNDGVKEDKESSSLHEELKFTGSHTSGDILKDPSSTSNSNSNSNSNSIKVDNSHNTTN